MSLMHIRFLINSETSSLLIRKIVFILFYYDNAHFKWLIKYSRLRHQNVIIFYSSVTSVITSIHLRCHPNEFLIIYALNQSIG